ncbi:MULTISPECIES: hypothetical protein [unclassified Moorena]|nr:MULTISPECIES: hypothetical protein [unclassified Moorena]
MVQSILFPQLPTPYSRLPTPYSLLPNVLSIHHFWTAQNQGGS